MYDQQEDYAKYRAKMSEKAGEFEDFVFDLLSKNGINVTRYFSRKWQYEVGECSGGVEVKFDDLMRNTGNLYIEVAEKSVPNVSKSYYPSGIYRSDNSWLYVIGDYDEVFVFAKRTLQHLDRSNRCERKQTPTSVGFLLPKAKARVHAARAFVALGSSDKRIER